MKKRSAGILLFRIRNGAPEVLLVHSGGPFWANKDIGSWSIPKGEFLEGEDPFDAARREFFEETGMQIDGDFLFLGTSEQSSRKTVHAWAIEGDFDVSFLKSNMFSMEWPPRSGMKQEFPEVDKAEWFSPEVAKQKIHKGQTIFIEKLLLARMSSQVSA